MKRTLIFLVFLINILFAQNKLYQVSTIDALLAGYYDGDKSVKDIKVHGDFGLGTFNGIDGEMIVYNSVVYQAKSTGEIIKVKDDMGVPFASVNFFDSEYTEKINTINSYKDLKIFLDKYKICSNYPCAFKIKGNFDYIKTRSAPKAEKPYPPLVKHITKTQNTFEKKDIDGVLVGFYLPKYFAKFNVPGYHFHFLSDKKDFGGHVLEVSINNAQLFLDRLYDVDLTLLQTKEFEEGKIEVGKDDLDIVEKDNQKKLDKNDYKKILKYTNKEIYHAFYKMHKSLQKATKELTYSGIIGEKTYKILNKVCKENLHAYDCSTIDTKGVIKEIAPKKYSNFIGADLSKQEQIIRLNKTKKPVVSQAIDTVEGFQGIDFEHPIFNTKKEFIGSVSILSEPNFFGKVIEPKIDKYSVEITIMQLDGRILYEHNKEEIGKNLFKNDLYKNYPSLIKAGKKIVKNKSGEAEYEFLDKNMKRAVKKRVLWNTLNFHGTQFRVTLAYSL